MKSTHLSPTNNVDMQMINRLTPVGTVIDDHSETTWD